MPCNQANGTIISPSDFVRIESKAAPEIARCIICRCINFTVRCGTHSESCASHLPTLQNQRAASIGVPVQSTLPSIQATTINQTTKRPARTTTTTTTTTPKPPKYLTGRLRINFDKFAPTEAWATDGLEDPTLPPDDETQDDTEQETTTEPETQTYTETPITTTTTARPKYSWVKSANNYLISESSSSRSPSTSKPITTTTTSTTTTSTTIPPPTKPTSTTTSKTAPAPYDPRVEFSTYQDNLLTYEEIFKRWVPMVVVVSFIVIAIVIINSIVVSSYFHLRINSILRKEEEKTIQREWKKANSLDFFV